MSINAQRAAEVALQSRLQNNGSWSERVRQDRGASGWPYPYLVHVFSGGGERNRLKRHDAELVFVVKAISDVAQEAAAAAQEADDLLNNHGLQDNTSDYLYGGSDWHILTVTREDYISLTEYVSETRAIHHRGARYRLIMEAI